MAAHRKHAWDDWFAQRRTVLVRGVDYDKSHSTMPQTIRNKASERGLRKRGLCVHLTDTGTEIIMEVRSVTEYPWDEWFNGDLLLLEKSTDFDEDVTTMRQKLKRAARRRAKLVGYSLKDEDGNPLVDSLIIKARDMTAEERVVGISLVRGRFVTK